LKVPGSRFQVPGSKLKVPGSRLQVPGPRFQVPGKAPSPMQEYVHDGVEEMPIKKAKKTVALRMK
jgi:hypothetical protein